MEGGGGIRDKLAAFDTWFGFFHIFSSHDKMMSKPWGISSHSFLKLWL